MPSSLRGKSGIWVASARAHDNPLPAPSSCREGMATLHPAPSLRKGTGAPNLHVPFKDTMSILSLHFPLREGTWLPRTHDFSEERHMVSSPPTCIFPSGGHTVPSRLKRPLTDGMWHPSDIFSMALHVCAHIAWDLKYRICYKKPGGICHPNVLECL